MGFRPWLCAPEISKYPQLSEIMISINVIQHDDKRLQAYPYTYLPYVSICIYRWSQYVNVRSQAALLHERATESLGGLPPCVHM